MIVHLAPRRVALISKAHGQQTKFPVDLDAVLAVDLLPTSVGHGALTLHLSNGGQVVAGTYTEMFEAGRDCGRLRVLVGLPAWPDVPAQVPRSRSSRLIAAVSRLVAITGGRLARCRSPSATIRPSALPPLVNNGGDGRAKPTAAPARGHQRRGCA